ncbi:riboflavin synthase [Sphingopyxis alaskensis]|jgi:riboflavin synthase|uniref:Riboflavin synthase n=1 Tax=Sphingopyxis alaskensis (strain DSM 13593 / LMG 18877 / RB2256) TaxID=317655 RepID=Q1GNS7_SPHAL|nr:riboflavin synthase [Sphingopyxis alaskensis]ABF54695.1 riboflavin synthase, alpha subunit [Sphingopyxis alaskensis RB2256]MCM3418464.1 riboflavin synthase [Sphingopyxis alaskensis]
MFTGIITDIGTIRSREDRGDTRLVIATAHDTATIDLGASIACSGACLTVVDKGRDADGDWFAVDASAETLARTAPGMWDAGRRLNIERALKVGDELGGHIVTGHVDAVGRIVAVEPVGDSVKLTVEAPAALAPHIAPKGSITLDGVSLTVNEVTDQPDGSAHFTLNIIPHTQAMTTLDEAAAGRPVNLEIDILARYLARMQARAA